MNKYLLFGSLWLVFAIIDMYSHNSTAFHTDIIILNRWTIASFLKDDIGKMVKNK